MSARQKMTMRTTIYRNNATVDPTGHPGPPKWEELYINMPCYIWETGDRKIYGTSIVDVASPMMIYPKKYDVQSGDKTGAVTTKNGDDQLFPAMMIEEPLYRKDHREARLKKIA
jgi:hypothetical protein